MGKCTVRYENNSVMNCVQLRQVHPLQPHPLTQGGFSQLHLVRVEYWYVHSAGGGRDFMHRDPRSPSKADMDSLLTKNMLVKSDLRPDPRGSRVLHERNVLFQVKNGDATFLPKYYTPYLP